VCTDRSVVLASGLPFQCTPKRETFQSLGRFEKSKPLAKFSCVETAKCYQKRVPAKESLIDALWETVHRYCEKFHLLDLLPGRMLFLIGFRGENNVA
jgi:hypothetical protein